jgi:1-acyl-sn-glycerol-3-phosphate acyltransferase
VVEGGRAVKQASGFEQFGVSRGDAPVARGVGHGAIPPSPKVSDSCCVALLNADVERMLSWACEKNVGAADFADGFALRYVAGVKARHDTVSNHLMARALKAVGKIYAQAYHRLEVLTPCQLPKRGAAILVCNHVSGLDPVLIQAACPRLITWMMAKEYYEIAALRWGFEAIEVIPVARSGKDLSATRAALRALHNGRVIGIFPEGRIETSRDILPMEVGAAMLAHHGKADVYSAYLDGTQRGQDMLTVFFRSQHAKLTFGPRIALKLERRRPDFEAATAVIYEAIERLKRAASSLQEKHQEQARGWVSSQ